MSIYLGGGKLYIFTHQYDNCKNNGVWRQQQPSSKVEGFAIFHDLLLGKANAEYSCKNSYIDMLPDKDTFTLLSVYKNVSYQQ